MDKNRYYLAALLKGRNIGNIKLHKAIKVCSDASLLWEGSSRELYEVERLSKISGLGRNIIEHREKFPDLPNKIYDDCIKNNVQLLTIYDDFYPIKLKEIFDPPLILFAQGDIELLNNRSLAIVGARKYSPYGESVAMEFAEKLTRAGVVIVSGAARGIDTKAHQGALRNDNGKTIAVLGCGLDIVYPPENKRLIASIRERGLILSEYTVGTKPLPAFFPLRNRIINGISEGTLVVEAAKRSGSLITADLAVSENRNLYAVPGSIYSPNSDGCHKLIRDGAMLVTKPDDILTDMGLKSVELPSTQKMTPEEAHIYRILSFDKLMTVDEIIECLPDEIIDTLSLHLLQMQIKGIIIDNGNSCYRRAERN